MARETHAHEGDIVVFLIGMTINKKWCIDQWFPVFKAMPGMLAELERNKAAAARGEAEDLGYLGSRSAVGPGGPITVQYWRSTEHLNRYASSPSSKHTPAWRAFNLKARKGSGAVGVWHETYAVPAGHFETIYSGTGPIGLGAATGLQPIASRGERSRERLAAGVS